MPTTKKNDNRPTFMYNNNPVRAAGLLAYVKINGRRHYLLRNEKKGRWSDIGGKTDERDTDIISVIVREVTEETNNHLFSPVHTYEQAYDFLNNILKTYMSSNVYSLKFMLMVLYIHIICYL